MTTLRLNSFVRDGAACHFARPVIEVMRPEEPHDHNFVEVFWIEGGRGWHWINGSRRALAAGSLVFIRARDCHSFSVAARGEALRMVNIAFSGRTWRTLRGRYELRDVFDDGRRDPVDSQFSPTQLAAAQSITSELGIGRVDRMAVDRFLLNLAHLIETEEDMAIPEGAAVPAWLRKMLVSLSNPMLANQPTGTRELAMQADCSPEHVARTFRRCLGRTPTEVLNEAKLARAAVRLASTGDDILAIALDSGFGNLSHFYKLFHERYHMTPRQYRIGQQRIA